MHDTHSVPNARYLLQIFGNGEWKVVAYLNDTEEAESIAKQVAGVRVFDTWKRAEVRFRKPLNSIKTTFAMVKM